MAALPSGAAPFFRTNRRRLSTNCKTGAERGLLFSLATGKNGYFISRGRQHGSRIWVSPCCPSRDCQAPSFKSVTNTDLEPPFHRPWDRSEEHTSELQSLMRISYAVFCLKKKTK